MPEQENAFEEIAYREAGHSLMFYLFKQGFMNLQIALNHTSILTPLGQVSIQPPLKDWGKLGFGLATLGTVAQIYMAGYLAEKIQLDSDRVVLRTADLLVQKAEHLIACSIEEFAGEISISERDAEARQILKKMYHETQVWLRKYWTAVDTLAQTLEKRKNLSEDEVFAIIEMQIPLKDRQQVQTKLNELKTREKRQ